MKQRMPEGTRAHRRASRSSTPAAARSRRSAARAAEVRLRRSGGQAASSTELLNSLRQQMMQPMFGAMQQAMQNMTPQDLKAMREMMQDLNRMLRQKAEGEEPDFDAFKEKWGDRFPASRASTSSSSRWAGRWPPCSRSCRALARAAQAARRDDALAHAPGRAAGSRRCASWP